MQDRCCSCSSLFRCFAHSRGAQYSHYSCGMAIPSHSGAWVIYRTSLKHPMQTFSWELLTAAGSLSGTLQEGREAMKLCSLSLRRQKVTFLVRTQRRTNSLKSCYWQVSNLENCQCNTWMRISYSSQILSMYLWTHSGHQRHCQKLLKMIRLQQCVCSKPP